MRQTLCDSLIKRSAKKDLIFLTADLGFKVLEPLRDHLKDRFINVGISEQNMVSMAAGLAKKGLDVWIYSISPFLYARAFEQIRNDICFHNLPVKLIGSGAGYGYGISGPTHHAIEDYGVLLTLPNLKMYCPCFKEDLYKIINDDLDNCPYYIRLGRDENTKINIDNYKKFRCLKNSDSLIIIIVIGSIIGYYLDYLLEDDLNINLWVVSELPIDKEGLPIELELKLQQSILIIIEEHVKQGSFGMDLSYYMINNSINPSLYYHFYANTHVFERHGSCNFLREIAGLSKEKLIKKLKILIR